MVIHVSLLPLNISLVWDTICRKQEVEGLRVRRIREFNLSLICKWCWRLREEKGCLWYKALATGYGEDSGTIGDRGRVASVWWRNSISIKRGDREGDGS
jgi:hypothetical protein